MIELFINFIFFLKMDSAITGAVDTGLTGLWTYFFTTSYSNAVMKNAAGAT